MNRQIANKLIQDLLSYLSYPYLNSQFCQLLHSDICQLKLDCLGFLVLSLTVQGKLSRQPRYQFLYGLSIFYFTSDYYIQLISLFNQVFLSILDHLPGSISDPKNLLDYLVGPQLSRSSTMHGASQIAHYTIWVCL